MTDPRPLAAAAERLRGRPGRPRKAHTPAETPAARLLDVTAAGVYLGVSPWTIRDLLANGTLRRVLIPMPGGRDMRRVLVDRDDLDRLIAAWKDTT